MSSKLEAVLENSQLPDEAVRLSGLVAARICHDLVSPVGAIGNGVDLLRELMPGGEDADLALIADSAQRANAILRLLRLAFGPAAPDGPPVARSDVATRLQKVLSGPRVSVEVSPQEGALAPPAARLAALMVLAARSLLGREGTVSLTLSATADMPMLAVAAGDRAGWPTEFADEPTSMPRYAEFVMLPAAARAAGAVLERIDQPGRVGLAARPA